MIHYVVPIYWKIVVVAVTDSGGISFLAHRTRQTARGYTTFFSNATNFETADNALRFVHQDGGALAELDQMPEDAARRLHAATSFANSIDQIINERLNPRAATAADNPISDVSFLYREEEPHRILEL